MAEADVISSNAPTDEMHPPKSFGRKALDYAKSRFNADNWFGSLVTACVAYVNYEGVQSARTRIVNGVPARDRPREISSQIQMGEKAWSFLSERGGEFPEGKSIGQRMLYAIRHPQRSSAQFEWLALMPVFVFNNANHIRLGLRAHGIGLQPGEVAYAPEKIRLYSGLYQLISQMLKGYGHFRDRNEVADAEAREPNPASGSGFRHEVNAQFLTPIKKMWKHDRVFLIGNALNIFSPVFSGVESWGKRGGSREEAKHLARQTAVTSLIVAAEGIYGAQRIAESNYIKKHQAGTGRHVARLEQKQPMMQEAGHANRLTSLRQAWKESQEQQI